MEPLKILITGIGITGKSAFRKYLFNYLKILSVRVEQFDCDYDRNKLPIKFSSEKIYLIEDVHGPCDNSVFSLDSFDFIFYLLPDPLIHFRFWISRMIMWYKEGKFSWDPDLSECGKWLGTSKPYDSSNIIPILKELKRDITNRRKWIDGDLEVIKKSGIPVKIIVPKLKGRRIIFSLIL